MEDWNRTYADDLACRWAAQHLKVKTVEALQVSYYGATLSYGTYTPGDPSAMMIWALVEGERHDIHVGFADIIDGMVKLAAEEAPGFMR